MLTGKNSKIRKKYARKTATENVIPLLNNIKSRGSDRCKYVPKTFFFLEEIIKKCNNSYIWGEAFTSLSLSVSLDTICMLPTYMHCFYLFSISWVAWVLDCRQFSLFTLCFRRVLREKIKIWNEAGKKKAKQTDQVSTWVQGQGQSSSPFLMF